MDLEQRIWTRNVVWGHYEPQSYVEFRSETDGHSHLAWGPHKWTENCEYVEKTTIHTYFVNFWDFFEKVSEAKWRYLGILYVYSCIVLISPIWN